MHKDKHNKEEISGNKPISDIVINIPILKRSVTTRVRYLHREDIEPEDDPDDHRSGVHDHNKLTQLSIRHNSQQADEHITNIMHKHHRGSNPRRIHNEIRHRDKGSSGEVVDNHRDKVGPPNLQEGEHNRVEVVPQLEHVVLLDPGDEGRERELLEGEIGDAPEDPPGLPVEDEEGDDGDGPVEDELPKLPGEALDVHLKVVPFVAVLGN